MTQDAKRSFPRLMLAPLLAIALFGCSNSGDAVIPQAVAMTEDAVGYYCQMYVLDHGGPKAQIHLKGLEQPLWFSQVSAAVDYLHDKERDRDIVAVYVSDMADAVSWGEPGESNWINADTGFFVLGSRQMGGMGTPEAVSFAARADAEAFREEYGGSVVVFADIPEGYGAAETVASGAFPVAEEGGHGG